MQRICVYCGSSNGHDPRYAETARQLGELLARRGLELVYGGGGTGLMGILADATLAAGGHVTGVIPRALLRREKGHSRLSEQIVVGSMHERKSILSQRSDAFVALPGGIGTLEELAETLTWSQLGLHSKPCGVVNVGGYFAPLLAFLDGAVTAGFYPPVGRGMLIVGERPDELLDQLAAYRAPEVPRWIDAKQI